tara:strand:- start:47269 stop:48063 length:795 start_codon:yes stop_codon:yes gene_type:complete
MSKRKFLKEVNEMTNKGIYPSLNILLEEDLFDMPDEKEKEDDKPSPGSDESAPDSDSPAPDADDSAPDSDDSTPDSDDEEAEQIKTSIDVEDVKKSINTIKSEPKIDSFVAEYLPNAKIFDNKYYNLNNFILLNEDAKEFENSLDDIQKVLKDREDDIKQIKFSAEKIKSGDPNFVSQIPVLVSDTIKKIKKFDSHYDIASVVAGDFFEKIKQESDPKDLKKNIEEFTYQLAAALDKRGISHSINVNNIEPVKYTNAKGAKASS